MSRSVARYHGHESARAEQLEGVPLASFTRRAAAFAIDMVIASMSYVVPAMIGATIGLRMGWLHGHISISFDPFHHEHWASLIWYVAFIAASNYIGNGATIGKKVMKIRAVSLIRPRFTLWTSFERALAYGASALEAFFGFFQYFLDKNHRTVHDRIAETIVIAERGRPVAVNSTALLEQEPVTSLANPARPGD